MFEAIKEFLVRDPTLFKVFLGSFCIGFSGAVMPGPVLARTLSQAPRHGILTGPLIIVGHMFLELALVLGLAYGLVRFLSDSQSLAVRLISLVGGAVLLWLAFSMFREIPKLTLRFSAPQDGAALRRRGLVVDGVVLSAANPYWILWWATTGLAYINLARTLGIAGLTAFFVGHILSDYVWYGFVSVLVAKGRERISDRSYRWLVGICAALLVGFGILFITAGVVGIEN
jgi:threonine/homoserine/homoserine lactone efflux protein